MVGTLVRDVHGNVQEWILLEAQRHGYRGSVVLF